MVVIIVANTVNFLRNFKFLVMTDHSNEIFRIDLGFSSDLDWIGQLLEQYLAYWALIVPNSDFVYFTSMSIYDQELTLKHLLVGP